MPLVECHFTKVEQEIGSPWGTIYTDHPQVKKVTTKVPEKLAEAARLKESGALVGLEYVETQKRTDDGRVFTNRYYERAGTLHDPAANGAGATPDGIDMVQPQQRGDAPEKKWSIALQAGGKLAVWTLPLMPDEMRSFEAQKKIATAWAEFFFFTPPPSSPTYIVPPPRPSESHGAYNEPAIEQPPPDDSFPF